VVAQTVAVVTVAVAMVVAMAAVAMAAAKQAVAVQTTVVATDVAVTTAVAMAAVVVVTRATTPRLIPLQKLLRFHQRLLPIQVLGSLSLAKWLVPALSANRGQ